MITKEFTPSWKTFLLIGLFGWAYLPTLGELFDKWMNDPQYSHGILVPLFSVYLLFRQSNKFPQNPTPWPVLGFTVLAIALLLRGLAALLIFLTLDAFSMVLCITGILLVLGGKDILRWSWQALVFSLFMIPLPYQVERMMGAELQQIATLSSTFLLQSFGQPALSEGNLILIEDVRLGVVEACSGLRMLMTFLAFAFGAVMLMDRGWVVKVLVLASAIPIALLTNILRITATGLVHIWMQTDPNKDSVLGFIHDFNGWMMMPVGLIFLMLELWLFKYLLIEPERVTYFR
jgi:exosortase